MDIDTLLGRADRASPVAATLIGVGQFGRTLVLQSRRLSRLDLRVLCDIDVDKLRRLCADAGIAPDDVVAPRDAAAARSAFGAGRTVITDDPEIALALPTDVVVEATGDAEAGARNAEGAIREGRHVVLVTKETDSVVGPVLAARAAAAGVVVTQVDGDQPSLLLALLSRLRTLGLEIVAAGKSSEYDFVYDPATGRVRAAGLEEEGTLPAELWAGDGLSASELLAARAAALKTIPQRAPPDFCEMCIVSNASGLRPDTPELHAGVLRVVELPDVYRGAARGGAFAADGRLDIFNCLRRPDETSAAGGVFAIVAAPDEETGRLFAGKGIPVSRDARDVLVFNPVHLLGVEAPLSIMVPALLGLATGSQRVEKVSDITVRATRDFAAGETLRGGGHHHKIDSTEPRLDPYTPLADDAPLPYYLAMNCRLARDLKKGEAVTRAHVVAPEGARVWALRAEQDGPAGT